MRRSVVVAAFVALVILIIGALEGYARYKESRRPIANAVAPHLYYPHGRLQRALVRDAEYYGHLHVNRLGFRGADVPAHKSAGTTRIIAIGASATFDVCASSDSATWTARLERALERRVPGRRFEVLNAGVPGYLMLDNIIRLHSELYAYTPDVILIYAGHGAISPSDADRARSQVPGGDSITPGISIPGTPWGEWLMRHSRLYARALARVGVRERPAAPLPSTARDWEPIVQRTAADFRRDLTSFVAIALGLGAKVAVAELATMTDFSTGVVPAEDSALWQRAFAVPPSVAAEGFRRFSEVQQEISARQGATFVPTRSFGIRGKEHYCPGDPLHFSHAGSALMGEKMAEFLVATDLLRATAPSPD